MKDVQGLQEVTELAQGIMGTQDDAGVTLDTSDVIDVNLNTEKGSIHTTKGHPDHDQSVLGSANDDSVNRSAMSLQKYLEFLYNETIRDAQAVIKNIPEADNVGEGLGLISAGVEAIFNPAVCFDKNCVENLSTRFVRFDVPTGLITDANAFAEEATGANAFIEEEVAGNQHIMPTGGGMNPASEPEPPGLLETMHPDHLPIIPHMKPRKVPGAFHNMTDFVVPENVVALISFGPGFVPPCIPNLFRSIDYLLRTYQNCFGQNNISKSSLFQPDMYIQYTSMIVDMIKGQEENMSMIDRMLVSFYKETVDFLKQRRHPDDQLTLVESDKGKCTMMMRLTEYAQKMAVYVEKMIRKGTYARLLGPSGHQTTVAAYDGNEKKKMAQVYRSYVRGVESDIKRSCGSEEDSSGMSSIDPELRRILRDMREFEDGNKVRLPYLFGVIKNHKEGMPVRPIVGTPLWFSAPLQRLFLYVSKKYMKNTRSETNISNVNDVVKKLHNLMVGGDCSFRKFDFVDMYGNINKTKAYAFLEDYMKTTLDLKECPIGTERLLQILKFNFYSLNKLSYDGKVYIQVDGLPQGAPDSGQIATIYVDYKLQIAFALLKEPFQLALFLKYVDDIIVYAPNNKLNGLCKGISDAAEMELTEEKSQKVQEKRLGLCDSISFLDIQIYVKTNGRQQKLYTRVYRKPQSSGRTVHFLSNQPIMQKIGTIKWFINRILDRTSTLFVTDDLEELHEQLLDNGYPLSMLRDIYTQTIHAHLLRLESGEVPFKHTHTEVVDRIRFLCGFSSKFSIKMNAADYTYNLNGVWRQTPAFEKRAGTLEVKVDGKTRFASTHPRPFRSYPYLCVELSALLQMLFKHHQMGTPVFRNDGTMFRLLAKYRPRKGRNQPTSASRVLDNDTVLINSAVSGEEVSQGAASEAGQDSETQNMVTTATDLATKKAKVKAATISNVAITDSAAKSEAKVKAATKSNVATTTANPTRTTGRGNEAHVAATSAKTTTESIRDIETCVASSIDGQAVGKAAGSVASTIIEAAAHVPHHLYIITCETCGMKFMSWSPENRPSLWNILMSDRYSAPYMHREQRQHIIGDYVYEVPSVGNISYQELIAFYHQLYGGLGVPCEDDVKSLRQLPGYLRLLVSGIVEGFPNVDSMPLSSREVIMPVPRTKKSSA